MFEYENTERALVNEDRYVGGAPIKVRLPENLSNSSIDEMAELVLEGVTDTIDNLVREHGYSLYYRDYNQEDLDSKRAAEIMEIADEAWKDYSAETPEQEDGTIPPFKTFLNWRLHDYFDDEWDLWQVVEESKRKVIADEEIDGLADAFGEAAADLWGYNQTEATQTMADCLEEIVRDKLDENDDSTPLEYLRNEKVKMIAQPDGGDVEHLGNCCSSTDVDPGDGFLILLDMLRISPHSYYDSMVECGVDSETLEKFEAIKDKVIEYDRDPILPIRDEKRESLCEILDNASYGGSAVYAVGVDLEDFLCRERGDNAPPIRCFGGMIGLHAFYNGSGYIASMPTNAVIELPADTPFNIDGASGYGIDSTYGLCGSAWKGGMSQKIEKDISQDEIDEIADGKLPMASTIILVEKGKGKPYMFKRFIDNTLQQLRGDGYEAIAEKLEERRLEVTSLPMAIAIISNFCRIVTSYA